jgi:hypothetical protein
MPYIPKRARDSAWQSAAEDGLIQNAGHFNYVITRLIHDYINVHGLKYETINSIIGVLECAKLELYRRVASPYEDMKRAKNGDVYDDVK